jgi:hypothetical protein
VRGTGLPDAITIRPEAGKEQPAGEGQEGFVCALHRSAQPPRYTAPLKIKPAQMRIIGTKPIAWVSVPPIVEPRIRPIPPAELNSPEARPRASRERTSVA